MVKTMLVVGKETLSPDFQWWAVVSEGLLNRQSEVSDDLVAVVFTDKMQEDFFKEWPEFTEKKLYGMFRSQIAESGAKRYIFSHVE